MKSVPKLIRRFLGILMLSTILLLLLNFAALIIIGSTETAGGSPWYSADTVAKSLTKSGDSYTLSQNGEKELKAEGAWAILIDNDTKSVVWQSDNLPVEIPKEYLLTAIADLTRGYINGYPTYTGNNENGLVVIGYPKERYWKLLWPSWDYSFIKNLPQTVLIVFLCNILAVLLIYIIANTNLLRSVKPIVDGIRTLPTKDKMHIPEKGVLSEIAANINRTSSIIDTQNADLAKKETARANWIAGVSHDIRTPLSMVMGYAGELSESENLSETDRARAKAICRQSERIKSLINDLNLSSKLEYNMQPTEMSKANAVSIVREVAVDFLNNDVDGKYPIEWETSEDLTHSPIMCDKSLLKRAISNLIENSINHNENGCGIFLKVERHDDSCFITVADNGVGLSESELLKLKNTPHYMLCDKNVGEQRHGLGLLIVMQIVKAHGGELLMSKSEHGGFEVTIKLKAENE